MEAVMAVEAMVTTHTTVDVPSERKEMTRFMTPLLKNAFNVKDPVVPYSSVTLRQVWCTEKGLEDSDRECSMRHQVKTFAVCSKSMAKSRLSLTLFLLEAWSLLLM